MPTVYKYVTGGREVIHVDQADEYKPDDIRQHWAQTFPELGNATWDEGKDEEGRRVVTFAKKVGTKGSEAILALLSIPEKAIPGVALLHRLYASKPATVDDILANALEIEAAINEADALAGRAEKAVKRCLDLKPVSAPRTPSGF